MSASCSAQAPPKQPSLSEACSLPHCNPWLQGSLLHYARAITSSFVEGAQILDCVIAVPAFWGQAQRQAMADAAGLAGLNVLSLINSHAAAALQFGIERDFTDKVENVIL